MSILFADMDFFKKINDTYGHDVGDTALIHVAQTIKRQVRQVDLVARYGGEEFIILLIMSKQDTNTNIAERIRQTLNNDALETNAQQIRFSVSIGITSLNPEDESIEDLIKRADAALYREKENGRNQVQVG